MSLGNKILELRKKSGLSQEQLGEKVDVTRQTISNWETNKFYPDIKSISLLFNIFHVTLDYFIEGDLDQMKKVIDENEKKNFLF